MKPENIISDTVTESEPYALYPTKDSINIRWFSEEPCRGRIIYCEVGSDKEQFSEEQISSVSHNIHLSGLNPFTRYEYYIYPDGEKYSFYTAASASCKSFRFAVFGDPQGHGHLKDAMAIAAEFKPHFAIGLGDFAGRADCESYLKFVSSSRALLDDTALLPVPGNHDYRRWNRPFDHDNDTEIYDLFFGTGAGNNYGFDYGQFRFIMLNFPDQDTFRSESWLRRELQTSRQLEKKVIIAHHCACFTSTKAVWAADDSLVPPLTEEFGDVIAVDFGGHIHTYERSMYPDETGVCFITSGGAGEIYSQYPVNRRENIFQQYAEDCGHVCLVEVCDHQVSIEAVDLAGKCFDHTVIDLKLKEDFKFCL
jgi:Calcineurin-like phosphoesterase